MRKRIFEIIEISKDNEKVSSIYDALMLLAIIISIVPLAFKKSYPFFYYTDIIATCLFIIDYMLRLLTADYICIHHQVIDSSCTQEKNVETAHKIKKHEYADKKHIGLYS
jgi:voltage-gated potassium channel